MEEPYGPSFFSSIESWAQAGARRMLPLVIELVQPKSMIDVGCGSGAWLAEARRLGVTDYLGVDGHTPEEALLVEGERFRLHDLTTPLRLDRRFDLAVCLEVAEHLPPEAADVLVNSLVELAPAVLFSAAVPHQGGHHHLNEQWPDYWAERFRARGLLAVDAVRPEIWEDDGVPWWYRQNTVLYCQPELVEGSARLKRARDATRDGQLAVVHPMLHAWIAHQRDELAREAERPRTLRELADRFPGAAGDAVKHRLRR